MNVCIVLIFFILIIQTFSGYNYEIITELIPKTFIFDSSDFNTYKIYKYMPVCDGNNENTQNIYIQFGIYNLIYFNLYLYDNYLDIYQDKKAKFQKYNITETVNYNKPLILIEDLVCGNNYYIVIARTSSKISVSPVFGELSIINAASDTINISLSKSEHFKFYGRNNKQGKEKKLYYYYNNNKYALIHYKNPTKFQIYENGKKIYDNITDIYSNIFEFKQNTNYTICFDSNPKVVSFVSLQFFNEKKFFKYDFNKGPFILYDDKYYLEVDISKIKKGDNILFYLYTRENSYEIRYQYKNNFKGNNFISLGKQNLHNFITIRKTTDDSSLYLYINSYKYSYYSFLYLIQDVEEITSDYNQVIHGPKYFFIDYFKLNKMNSIGIMSDKPFFIYEQEMGSENHISLNDYKTIYITKKSNSEPHIFKRALIFFNSTDEVHFQVKKLNHPIIYPFINGFKSNVEYYQLCEGDDTPNELYFYYSVYEKYSNYILKQDLFIPVFGNFESYFIEEDEIRDISDLDFEKLGKNKFFNTIDKNGYLYIKCKNPTMIKHSLAKFNQDNSNLKSGNSYYFNYKEIENLNFTFDSNLFQKKFELKFKVYGIHPTKSIKLSLETKTYELSINSPLEITYIYNQDSYGVFEFIVEEEIESSVIVNIMVGYSQEDLDYMYKEMDFVNSIGALTIEKGKGVIIKIPENFNEELYDYSIIFPDSYNNLLISYDKLVYQIPELGEYNSPLFPLFKTNPYDSIVSKDSNNKYFYISIFNNFIKEIEVLIKKPKIYTGVKLNQINILPQLKNEDKKYYYQIEVPESNHNLLIQTKNDKKFKISLSIDSIQYPLIDTSSKNIDFYYNSPIDEYNNPKKKIYINYYDINNSDGFINIFEANELIHADYYKIIELKPTIQKNEETNKIKIKINSLSYAFYPNVVKYYILINIEENYPLIYSIIAGQKKADTSKCQYFEIVEDNGSNEIFEKEIGINFNLINNSSYKVFILPVDAKSNKIHFYYSKLTEFKYIKNTDKYNYLFIITYISCGLSLLIIIVLIIYLKKGKRHISLNENIINDCNNEDDD